ncbi:hypothetical protein FKP32DRAFT_1028770 [Trametes sanguinea]|nr:hypothetical protein FKP32DRAFT_1028770 [Trametes sanguinea]
MRAYKHMIYCRLVCTYLCTDCTPSLNPSLPKRVPRSNETRGRGKQERAGEPSESVE